MQVTADEAHKPHESEIRHWLQAFQADPVRAFTHIPAHLLHLMQEMDLIGSNCTLTSSGHEELARAS